MGIGQPIVRREEIISHHANVIDGRDLVSIPQRPTTGPYDWDNHIPPVAFPAWHVICPNPLYFDPKELSKIGFFISLDINIAMATDGRMLVKRPSGTNNLFSQFCAAGVGGQKTIQLRCTCIPEIWIWRQGAGDTYFDFCFLGISAAVFCPPVPPGQTFRAKGIEAAKEKELPTISGVPVIGSEGMPK